MTYSQKLTDPRWQRKRLEILQRDNFTCTSCGNNKKTLHVHHLKYFRNPWEISSDHLKTLCEDCHAKTHEKKVLITKVVFRDPILITAHYLLSIDFKNVKFTLETPPYIIQYHYKTLITYTKMTEEEFRSDSIGKHLKDETLKSWVIELESTLNEICKAWGFILTVSKKKIYGSINVSSNV